MCVKLDEEARKFSGNSRVYLAQGVRCDSKNQMQDGLDNFHSPSNAAAVERKRVTTLWNL